MIDTSPLSFPFPFPLPSPTSLCASLGLAPGHAFPLSPCLPLFVSLGLLFLGVVEAGHAASRPTVQDLHWLSGCWESASGATSGCEQWMRPDGGTMLGMSRTVRDGRTVAWEHLRIWQDEAGEIYYTALPSGQAETSFRLTHAAPGEATFENPDHDFPQRILYRLVGEDSLLARIEGVRDGRERAIDFPMRRAERGGPGPR